MKKFRPDYENLDNQVRSDRPKTVDTVDVLQCGPMLVTEPNVV